MTTNSLRNFAGGILLATVVVGTVYYLTPRSVEEKVEKVNLSSDEMIVDLETEGYVVLTEEELQTKINESQVAVADQEKPEVAAEKIVYRTMLTVTSGMTTTDVAQALAKANIIKDTKSFTDIIEKKNLVQDLRPGTFEVQSDMTQDEVIATIFKK
ncbi:MAG: aminodeoxychorismate lyase [Bacillus sp. (in: firmicutes)]